MAIPPKLRLNTYTRKSSGCQLITKLYRNINCQIMQTDTNMD
jgi:hypothetical protein